MAADVGVVVNSFLNEQTRLDEHVSLVLECFKERQCLQDSNSTGDLLAKINEYLNSRNNRLLGFCMLGELIDQCDTNTFTANCNTWLRALLELLQTPAESSNVLRLSVKLLEKLLRFAAQFSDLSRTIATSIIPNILAALLNLNDPSFTLDGLCVCMKHMPGPSGNLKNQIESCILTNLEHWDKDVRKVACDCFALLAGFNVPGATDKTKTNWEVQWRKILVTVNCSLDLLYESVGEHLGLDAETKTKSSNVLSVAEVPIDEPKRTVLLATRCTTLLQCLTMMTRKGISKLVSFPVEDTLKLLERITSVNEPCLRQSVGVEVVLLRTVLPLIHVASIELVDSLILRCGSTLLPYSTRLATLLMRTLSWTIGSAKQGIAACDQERPYSKLRCAVYDCLEHWSNLAAPLPTHILIKVTSHIMDDVRPPVSQTKLLVTTGEQCKQGKSKRGKKRKLQEDIEQLATTLYALLMNGSTHFSSDTFRDLQTTLLGLILQVQSSTPLPSPYSDTGCRHGVYRCLLACLLSRPSSVPSIINCAVRCFSQGLRDPQYQVSSYCREALTMTRALMHPCVPSLGETFQLVALPTGLSSSATNHHTAVSSDDTLINLENTAVGTENRGTSCRTDAASGDSAKSMRVGDLTSHEVGGILNGRHEEGIGSEMSGAEGNNENQVTNTTTTGNLHSSTNGSTRALYDTGVTRSNPVATSHEDTLSCQTDSNAQNVRVQDSSRAVSQTLVEVDEQESPKDRYSAPTCNVDNISLQEQMVQKELLNKVTQDALRSSAAKKMRYDKDSEEIGLSKSAEVDKQLEKSAKGIMETTLKAAKDQMDDMLASFVDSSPDSDDLEGYM